MRRPELLAELPDDVCRLLDIDTDTRRVMIELATVTHIFQRRSFVDATTIMRVLARRRFDPLYCGRLLTDKRLFFIVERTADHDRVVIAFKFLRGTDEIWVSTGYLVGYSTLRAMLRAPRFVIYHRMSDR